MPFIDDLNENTPLNTSAVATGAPALREIKATLLDSFPFLDDAVTEFATDILLASDAAAVRTLLDLADFGFGTDAPAYGDLDSVPAASSQFFVSESPHTNTPGTAEVWGIQIAANTRRFQIVMDAPSGSPNVPALYIRGTDGSDTFQAWRTIPKPATASQIRANASTALTLEVRAAHDAAGFVDGGSGSGEFNLDFSTGWNFTRALTGNGTLGNPTNVTVGRSGVVAVSASGGIRTLAKGSNWKSNAGIIWPITIPSGQEALISYFVRTSTFLWITGVDINPA